MKVKVADRAEEKVVECQGCLECLEVEVWADQAIPADMGGAGMAVVAVVVERPLFQENVVCRLDMILDSGLV